MLGQMTGGSSREQHLDLKPVANSVAEDALRAAETVYQLAMQQIPHEVEMSQELLIYPEDEGDAVRITEGDMAELQPGGCLGNNIVDFYIRFLERGLSPEHGNRFYFFSSFFFTKLLQSTASTDIDPYKVDYEQLRKWTKEVNLFEKDYVFIPILKSSHWSLVIICHLNSLTHRHAPGKTMRSPCVFHLDPIEGQHESFEGLIRSYVLQAWMERFQASSNLDQLLALCQMKYVKVKVPQQDNSHDCGLYVLNYIEAFLEESTSSNFSFTSSERGSHFLSPHFVPEVLGKRQHIQNLIHELSNISQKRAQKHKAIQEVLQSTQNLRSLLLQQGNSKACIKAMKTIGPTLLNGQDFEGMHVSTHEDANAAQYQQSTLMSKGDNESIDGLQIRHAKYDNRSDSLSPKHQHVEHEVETIGTTNFDGPIFEAKHASIAEDSTNVHHQQSSGVSRLDYVPLKCFELQQVENQRVTESLSGELRYLEPKDMSFMDLFEASKGKNRRGRNMTKEETWMLLSCKLEGGRFCKGNGGATHWNLISEEIAKTFGSLPSADRCRLRYDTLLKAYKTYKKYCMKTGKTFFEITREERLDLKLATTLTKEQYIAMDEICNKAIVSQKRTKRSSNACNDMFAPIPPPISQGLSFEDEVAILDSVRGKVEVALRSVIPVSVFNSLKLQYKLLETNKKYFCMTTGKTFFKIAKEGRLDLKLATTLSKEWYTTMDEICNKVYTKLSSNACNDLDPLSVHDSLAPIPPPISQGLSFEDEAAMLDSARRALEAALRNVIPTRVFDSLNEDLQSTLLNLVQECSWELRFEKNRGGRGFYLEDICPKLAILQDRDPREILIYVLKLWELNLVHVKGMVFEEGNDLAHIDLWKGKRWFFESKFYEKVSNELLWKNPHLKTYCCRMPMEQSSLQYIRVLELVGYEELEHLDLSEFPSLQSLTFNECPKMNLVRGWEVATRLESISITYIAVHIDFDTLQSFSRMMENGCYFNVLVIPWQLSQFSQCAKLRRLDIFGERKLSEIDFKGLKFLEFLSLGCCTFSSIQGLSGLQALKTLHLQWCPGLRRVPGLGCLKELTDLNLCYSGIEDVIGVGELHLLTSLNFLGCASLKWLPFLGHLGELVYLDLKETGVKEILGRENLMNLKTLSWDTSERDPTK